MSSEIDLLAIDIDGMDYWIWKAITEVQPRVVVIEYNASFGAERSITVPYEKSFSAAQKHESGFYHGAALAALERLGRERGYSLVACDSRGVNAFFVREELAKPHWMVLSPVEAYFPHFERGRVFSSEQQFAQIAELPFQEIPASPNRSMGIGLVV